MSSFTDGMDEWRLAEMYREQRNILAAAIRNVMAIRMCSTCVIAQGFLEDAMREAGLSEVGNE